MLEPPINERLGDVVCPTLVIVGDEDIADMQSIAAHLASSIDGARLVAERTGRYRPGHTYYYDGEGKETTVWLSDENPAAVRVTVFKDDHEVPGVPVRWKERVQSTNAWKTMGRPTLVSWLR